VVFVRWGRPFIRLAPALEARVSGALQHRFGGGDGSGHAVWHLSLSHDGPVAQAFVVGEWRL
jgi:holo-[acyl-carrier protein] synthase